MGSFQQWLIVLPGEVGAAMLAGCEREDFNLSFFCVQTNKDGGRFGGFWGVVVVVVVGGGPGGGLGVWWWMGGGGGGLSCKL